MSAWPVSPEPFRIEPNFSERIWGARGLAPLFPEIHNLKSPVGEAWLTGLDCQIVNGQFTGKRLGQAWQEMTVEWKGSVFEGEADFPLLLKFIFPKDKLSIQVHPDDKYASLHEKAAGGRGKTEMWHIVSAEPGARLLAGLKQGVTKEILLTALAKGTLEDLFQPYEVHAGDTFFIPAGMPHTIGPNMVVCEVQEYSDLTYRLYDYERLDAGGKPRELQVEKALAVMNYSANEGGLVMPRPIMVRGKKLWDELVNCSYFSTLKFDFSEPIDMKMGTKLREGFELWVFLEGEGKIEWSCNPHSTHRRNFGEFSYRQGECWFLPAVFGTRGYYPKKKTSILVATPRKVKRTPEKKPNAD